MRSLLSAIIVCIIFSICASQPYQSSVIVGSGDAVLHNNTSYEGYIKFKYPKLYTNIPISFYMITDNTNNEHITGEGFYLKWNLSSMGTLADRDPNILFGMGLSSISRRKDAFFSVEYQQQFSSLKRTRFYISIDDNNDMYYNSIGLDWGQYINDRWSIGFSIGPGWYHDSRSVSGDARTNLRISIYTYYVLTIRYKLCLSVSHYSYTGDMGGNSLRCMIVIPLGNFLSESER